MTRDADDDALRWAGDDDPTLSATPDHAPAGAPAPGGSVVGGQASVLGAEPAAGEAAERRDSAAASSATLILLGILGGVYLLYTVGWMISAARIPSNPTDIVAGIMFTLGLWLAALAPALWFGLSLWLTRTGSRWRLFWLGLGALVLVPLPFIAGVGAAS